MSERVQAIIHKALREQADINPNRKSEVDKITREALREMAERASKINQAFNEYRTERLDMIRSTHIQREANIYRVLDIPTVGRSRCL